MNRKSSYVIQGIGEHMINQVFLPSHTIGQFGLSEFDAREVFLFLFEYSFRRKRRIPADRLSISKDRLLPP
jgi:hypothetical protein